MPLIIQLKDQDLIDTIVEVFSDATGLTLDPTSHLAGGDISHGDLIKALRKLDTLGAFIPEEALKLPTSTLQDWADASQAFPISTPPKIPTLWDRVRGLLATAGAMPAKKILPNTTLTQIGVGSDWLGYADLEFKAQGLRFFDSDFKKATTADDVFQVVFALLDKKTSP